MLEEAQESVAVGEADSAAHKSAPAAELRDVAKVYGQGAGQVPALRDVWLTIETGHRVALLGRSGSGKSTLLNLLGAVDRPSRGRVCVGGNDLSAMSDGNLALFRRRKLGFIFQSFHLVPSLTVMENVSVPLMLDRALDRLARTRVDKLLERLGIAALARRYPDELSGGQQQRVAVARAVVHQPVMVLADEPTGNLDVQTGREILDLLSELPRELGVTLVMATHSAEAAGRCDGSVVLEDGRIIEVCGIGARSGNRQ